MAAPNMAAMTASLEKSLQNFSLNHHEHSNSSSSSSNSNNIGGIGEELRYAAGNKSSAADSPENLDLLNDSSLDLHSEIPLPHFWEQCLDLKTGEIYYINWRTGMRSQEDPRTNPDVTADCYSDDDDDSCSYDSEGSFSESSRTVVAKEEWRQYNNISWENNREKNIGGGGSGGGGGDGQVLVVAGCKSCLMYFMVPKQEEDCPKCCGQLLHFDPRENGSA